MRARAVLHTLLNAGMGLGTVWGALVLAVDSSALYRATFVGGAVAALACAVLFARLPAVTGTSGIAAARRPGLTALRDRRFVVVTGLSAVLQLTMPVLSVIPPLWVATRTGAPEWVAAVALALNMVLAIGAVMAAAGITLALLAARAERVAPPNEGPLRAA